MRQDPDEPRRDEPAFPWPPVPEPSRRQSSHGRRKHGGTGLLLVVALLAGAVGAGAAVVLLRSSGGDSPASGATGTGSTRLNAGVVVGEVEPGVVDIVARDRYSGLVAEGTGMILSADGLVLTNNHVIDGSTSVGARLVSSGRTYQADVLGYDAADDVALLRLTAASGLHPVRAGDSSRIRVGQPVLALGNAAGQGGTPAVSSGYVTALDQTISPSNSATGASETLHGTIQSSAQVADGDSGGPLANAAGQVIGMDTAAASGPGGSGATSGYAIQILAALRIARSIEAGRGGASVHIGLPGFIGVSVTNVSSSCGESSAGASPPGVSGAKICVVYPGTPASRAGLVPGDVITSAGGAAVGSAGALTAITGRMLPGAEFVVGYADRNDRAHMTQITLVVGPAG
jgi:S1-C subfamily serine protease